MTDTKTMGLGAALERLLTWPNPDGTIEKAYIPAWLARDCRAALAQQGEPVALPTAAMNDAGMAIIRNRHPLISRGLIWSDMEAIYFAMLAAAPVAQQGEPSHYLDILGTCYTAQRAKFLGKDLSEMLELYAAAPVAQPAQEWKKEPEYVPPLVKWAQSLQPAQESSLSWGGFNLYGNSESIAKAKQMLHDSGTVPELKQRIAELQSAQPVQESCVISHTCAGFRGAFESEHKRKPTEQEIWHHAIRSWRDLNPAPQPAQEPIGYVYSIHGEVFKTACIAADIPNGTPVYISAQSAQPAQEFQLAAMSALYEFQQLTGCDSPEQLLEKQSAQPAQETAKQRYDRLMVDEEEQDPVERLRYFCSIALTPQDWLDVEQFFSDVTKAQPAQPLRPKLKDGEFFMEDCRFESGIAQPLTEGEIYTAYITAANQTLRPQDARIAIAFARAIEAAIKGG